MDVPSRILRASARLREIRATNRLHTANVEVQPSEMGTSSIQMVRYARELFEKGDRHKHIQPRHAQRHL